MEIEYENGEKVVLDEEKPSETPKKERKKRAKSGSNSDDGRAADRISIALTADGRIDWGHMRQDSADRVRALLETNAPETRQPGGDLFTDEQVANLLALEGQVKGVGFALVKRVPPGVVASAFTYNERAKAALVPAAKAVLNKYCPAAIGEKAEIIGFVAVYIAVTQAQFQHAGALTMQYRLQLAAARGAIARARAAQGTAAERPIEGTQPPAPATPSPVAAPASTIETPPNNDGESLENLPAVEFETELGAAGE